MLILILWAWFGYMIQLLGYNDNTLLLRYTVHQKTRGLSETAGLTAGQLLSADSSLSKRRLLVYICQICDGWWLSY